MFALDREREKEKKKRTIAFILSLFIPGLGQLVRKRIGAGLFFLGVVTFIIWLIVEIQKINPGIIGTSLGLLILHCFNLYDAYKGPAWRSAPCERKCPAGINIPYYIALTREGKYDEALTSIMDRMPFPAACGRICHHPCESICALRTKEGPVAIELLKRAVADRGTQALKARKGSPSIKSVGIIGAGPSGLSAGYFLKRRGYNVIAYEKEAEAGGLLRWAIPDFRLPNEVVAREISTLTQFGIEVRCGVTIGKEISFDELRKKHDAVLIATGASRSTVPGIPGADLAGVSPALEVLSSIQRGNAPSLRGATVAVIGGGNTSFDVARTAIRAGAKSVTIYYRRNKQEMPGNIEELSMAQREGVKIEYQVTPVRFTGDKRVAAIELVRTELKKGAGSSRSEVLVTEGTNFSVSCDHVFIATGQEPDFDFLPDDVQKEIMDTGSIRLHPITMETPLPGIFAAGDVAGNTMNTVVDAVETGRKAAQGIDWYLRRVSAWGRMLERLTAFDYPIPHTLPPGSRKTGRRRAQKLLEKEKASSSHAEVELGLSEEDAKAEASRCLQCNRL
jgi:NADPH-dependent glutamate synthase beta subunit-like oxidoreductase